MGKDIDKSLMFFFHSYIGESDEYLADIMGVSTKTIRDHRSGRVPLTCKFSERLLLRCRDNRLDEGIFFHFSVLAKAIRSSIVRANSEDDLFDDMRFIENILNSDESCRGDWSILHLAAHVSFSLWIFDFLNYSSKVNKEVSSVCMDKLLNSYEYWSLSREKCDTRLKSYIDYNLSTTTFLINVFGVKNSFTGKLIFNPKGDPKNHASYDFYKVYKELALKISSIHAWRDAVEMAIYLDDNHLIDESVSGYVDCVNGKSFNKRARRLALDILQGVDNSYVLNENNIYTSFLKSIT